MFRPRPRRRLAKRAVRIVAATSALLGALAAMLVTAVAPASAAPMSVSFTITPFYSGEAYHCVNVFANIPTNQYDTYGYLNNGAHAQVSLWGDDSPYYQLIERVGDAYQNAPVNGLSISGSQGGIDVRWNNCYQNSRFNEDTYGGDELFVKVTVWDGDGAVLAQKKSAVLYRSF